MPRVTIHYLTLANTYRTGKGSIDGVVLRNKGDRQTHSVNWPAIFRKGPLYRSKGWEEFLTKEEPPPPLRDRALVAHYEDESPWPIFVDGIPPLKDLDLETGILYESAHQRNAVVKGGREANAPMLRSAPVVISAAVVVVLVIIVGITVLRALL